MNCLFDTSAYGHMVKGHSEVAAILREADTVYIPNVVMAELRYGFALGSRQNENERLLSRFVNSQKIRLLLPDHATTDHFVQVACHARKRGVALSIHDVWIAGLALQWEATLVSFDRDFEHLQHGELALRLLKTS